MDEHDLRTLGREPLGPAGRARPIEEVLRRGRGLRRRVVVARATAAAAAVVLVAGAAALASRPGPDADVTMSGDVRNLPVKRQEFCDQPAPEPVPADELDGLRLIPTTPPEGVEVRVAEPMQQSTGTCVDVDPALALRADGGDRTVEAEITLEGPFSEPYRGADDVALEPTQLRGREAARTYDPTAPESYAGFTWTEADGASWILTGVGVDEATVRGFAESLQLRGLPPEGEPAATVPDDAVPDGFEVTWQAQGLPAVEGPTRLEWVVTTTPPVPAGCEITIATTDRQAPPGRMFSAMPGVRSYHEVPVRGTEDGFATEQHGEVFLEWEEANGVVGSLRCAGDVDTAVRIADSLVEVGPGDPRIVTGSPG
jgi:hypothetical protein